MDEEFEAVDKLDEVCGLLDSFSVEYEIHRHDEDEFIYLDDEDVSIKIPNPYINDPNRAVFIDFQEEFSLFFGAEWHEHYQPCEGYYKEFLETLSGFLKNELCSAAVFIGDDRRWGASICSSAAEIAEKSAEEIFAFLDGDDARELKKDWIMTGVEVHFLFWDPKLDKIVVYEKEETS